MEKFHRKLFVLSIGLLILVGIPYLFGSGWLVLSWLPAMFAMMYLDEA